MITLKPLKWLSKTKGHKDQTSIGTDDVYYTPNWLPGCEEYIGTLYSGGGGPAFIEFHRNGQVVEVTIESICHLVEAIREGEMYPGEADTPNMTKEMQEVARRKKDPIYNAIMQRIDDVNEQQRKYKNVQKKDSTSKTN